MKTMAMAFAVVLAVSCLDIAVAKTWGKKYIEALPDSAFASVEIDQNGVKHRHLPHHTASGAVDMPHLKAALGRWKQIHWVDRKNAQPALEHLKKHAQKFGAHVK